MKLFFDLETTGLPKQISFDKWYPPEEIDKYNSSRIIEIGIILVDKNEKIKETYNAIIKPDTFTKLEPIITKITGITDSEITVATRLESNHHSSDKVYNECRPNHQLVDNH